ncbi:hypothetical protein CERSUDRAFT_101358 [Gelatoporia subvermispora B]|uniref:Uncharacterized protein n=1 Tax=Ceriporiopsis subvermispora (strain B) TaxID=914234 RepID=M2Q0W2_CERS8|nr:hypothetical protein CERSUDRAFT_101358 [Gelatoporia subvermispora B]
MAINIFKVVVNTPRRIFLVVASTPRRRAASNTLSNKLHTYIVATRRGLGPSREHSQAAARSRPAVPQSATRDAGARAHSSLTLPANGSSAHTTIFPPST